MGFSAVLLSFVWTNLASLKKKKIERKKEKKEEKKRKAKKKKKNQSFAQKSLARAFETPLAQELTVAGRRHFTHLLSPFSQLAPLLRCRSPSVIPLILILWGGTSQSLAAGIGLTAETVLIRVYKVSYLHNFSALVCWPSSQTLQRFTLFLTFTFFSLFFFWRKKAWQVSPEMWPSMEWMKCSLSIPVSNWLVTKNWTGCYVNCDVSGCWHRCCLLFSLERKGA